MQSIKKTQLDSFVRINANNKKTFIYDFCTYLKDSNAYGNNYFARIFEWQGICREAWFFSCVTKDFLKDQGVLITKRAYNDYVNETFPFQKIRCLLNVRDIKKASFYLHFIFCVPEDEKKIFSKGYQQIVFANHHRKIIKFPDYILAIISEYII